MSLLFVNRTLLPSALFLLYPSSYSTRLKVGHTHLLFYILRNVLDEDSLRMLYYESRVLNYRHTFSIVYFSMASVALLMSGLALRV